jgi:hypothetical protein
MPENFGVMATFGKTDRTMTEEFPFGRYLLVDFQPAFEAKRFKENRVVYVNLTEVHFAGEYISERRKIKGILYLFETGID